MNSGWRGIIASCLLALLVLTTVFFLKVDSAVLRLEPPKHIPAHGGSKSSSAITPPKGGFLNYCWNPGKKDCQMKPNPVTIGDNKNCWCTK